MGKFEDLTGNTYGRLTVISRADNDEYGHIMWKCLCECGETCTVLSNSLTRTDGKETRSCGCLHKEKLVERSTKHGKAGEKIYYIWQKIISRCTNPDDKNYHNYGGRGITICEEWLDFQNFYDYVSTLEHFGEKGYSLDRIDNNGNYEPSNVRWADSKTQQRNKANNRLVEYQGETMTLIEASEKSGIGYGTLQRRIRLGWAAEDLFKPVKGGRKNCIEPENIMKS